MSPQEAYDQLALYTLSKRDPEFIHQYIVDTFMAQNATDATKPIGLYFALIGLFLHLEKNYSGREVQLAHMKLGKLKKVWPRFKIPEFRGNITVFDVLKKSEGSERNRMINEWARDVWAAWQSVHKEIADSAKRELL